MPTFSATNIYKHSNEYMKQRLQDSEAKGQIVGHTKKPFILVNMIDQLPQGVLNFKVRSNTLVLIQIYNSIY